MGIKTSKHKRREHEDTEDIGHGILRGKKRGPFGIFGRRESTDYLLEDPNRRVRRVKIKYDASGRVIEREERTTKGGPSDDFTYLPTRGFGRTPAGIDRARLNYRGLRAVLTDVNGTRVSYNIGEIEDLVATYDAVRTVYGDKGRWETIGGEKDSGGFRRDLRGVMNYLRKAKNRKNRKKEEKHWELQK